MPSINQQIQKIQQVSKIRTKSFQILIIPNENSNSFKENLLVVIFPGSDYLAEAKQFEFVPTVGLDPT